MKSRHRSRIPWQRLTLSLIGISMIVAMWRWATYHLYALPAQSIAAFTSITTNALYVIGALVVFFVTGRLVYEWRLGKSANLDTPEDECPPR